MKLLQKLAPVAILASTAAVVVPFATSCGKGWTSFDAKTFDEQKYQGNIHPEVSEGWDEKTIWKDFGNSKVAFDTDIRFSTYDLNSYIDEELEPDEFPTFDVKYRNFKAEWDDDKGIPYVSYDLESSIVLDYLAPFAPESNTSDIYRSRIYLSLSMRHVPVKINCEPWEPIPPVNEVKHCWYFELDMTENRWTNESNLNYSSDMKFYLCQDGKEYYKNGEKLAYEMNTNVGIDWPYDPFFYYVTSLESYCYQKVAPKS